MSEASAVDAATPQATWEGVETELAKRGQLMIELSEGRLRLRRGRCTPEEQIDLYLRWDVALRRHGRKRAHDHAEYAAFPGTSNHERKRATAIDVDCDPGYEQLRRDLAKKCGLKMPIEDEEHHLELDGNRKITSKVRV